MHEFIHVNFQLEEQRRTCRRGRGRGASTDPRQPQKFTMAPSQIAHSMYPWRLKVAWMLALAQLLQSLLAMPLMTAIHCCG